MYSEYLKEQCDKLSPQMVCKGNKHTTFVDNLLESTKFLNEINASLTTRFYCVNNNITEIPQCVCGNFVMANKKDNNLGFTQYCSPKCSRSNKTISLEILKKLEDKDWLYNQRITLKKSKELIAEELGCSVIPVNKWIKIHNIPEVKYNKSNTEVLKYLEDYDWLYTKHKVEKKSCEEIASILNSSKSTVSIYLNKLNIDANLANSYPKESKPSKECMEVVEYIKSIYNGEILIDRYGIIGELQLDIYLPELNIAFEYNGVYSHLYRPEYPIEKFAQRKDARYHVEKTKRCEAMGIQLIHIFSSSWKMKTELWKSFIKNKLKLVNDKIYARKCYVREITTYEKDTFLEENHLQGKDKSLYKFGLFNNGYLISVITFGKSRYNQNYTWELIRFCVKRDVSVVGGFSKLLAHFKKMYDGSIVSYADRTYSNGNMYAKNGFSLLCVNKPSYWYVAKNSEQLLHRSNFKKSKLLTNDNEHLTEEEIMFENGYSKIFNCGTLTFVYE